jgi:hypothetical protein
MSESTTCVRCQTAVAGSAAACPSCGLPFAKPGASGAGIMLCGLCWIAGAGIAAMAKSDIQLILAAVVGMGGIAWLAALRTSRPIAGMIKREAPQATEKAA